MLNDISVFVIFCQVSGIHLVLPQTGVPRRKLLFKLLVLFSLVDHDYFGALLSTAFPQVSLNLKQKYSLNLKSTRLTDLNQFRAQSFFVSVGALPHPQIHRVQFGNVQKHDVISVQFVLIEIVQFGHPKVGAARTQQSVEKSRLARRTRNSRSCLTVTLPGTKVLRERRRLRTLDTTKKQFDFDSYQERRCQLVLRVPRGSKRAVCARSSRRRLFSSIRVFLEQWLDVRSKRTHLHYQCPR